MTDIIDRLNRGEFSYDLPSGSVYQGSTTLHREAIEEIKKLRSRVGALESALTPSGDTKAVLWGEFYIEVEDHNPEYDEDFDVNDLLLSDFTDEDLGRYVRLQTSPTLKTRHPVDWTTVKEIMKSIKDYADGISGISKN